MIVVGSALVLAATAIALYAAVLGRTAGRAVWPDEVPLQTRDNRARDQQVSHLERLLTANSPTAAHDVVREIAGALLAMPVRADRKPDPATVAFLLAPPSRSAERYRRDLAAALDRLERP